MTELLRDLILTGSGAVSFLCLGMAWVGVRRFRLLWGFSILGVSLPTIVLLIAEQVLRVPTIPLEWRPVTYVAGLVGCCIGIVGVWRFFRKMRLVGRMDHHVLIAVPVKDDNHKRKEGA